MQQKYSTEVAEHENSLAMRTTVLVCKTAKDAETPAMGRQL